MTLVLRNFNGAILVQQGANGTDTYVTHAKGEQIASVMDSIFDGGADGKTEKFAQLIFECFGRYYGGKQALTAMEQLAGQLHDMAEMESIR